MAILHSIFRFVLKAQLNHIVLILMLPFLIGVLTVGGCGSTPARQTSVSDRQYSFWPQFPVEPRVQFLVTYRYSSDVSEKTSKLDELVFGKDSSVLPIVKPYGIEMKDGKIYVCDIRNPGLVVLDLVKKQTRILTTSGVGGMSQPTDVAVAPDGLIYVADAVRGVIFVFDRRERHIKSFGEKGLKPVSIAVHGDELYVADFGSLSIVAMDRHTGMQTRTIGGPGGEDGSFVRPLGLDVDDNGYVYVSDVIKCRLQKFDPEGNFVSAVGEIGDAAGSFVRPKHLAVDSEGIVYVADAAFDNVQMFDDQSRLLMHFGSGGSHLGSMNLPAGVCTTDEGIELFEEYIHPAFDAKRLVLVTNQFGTHKISVYAMGQLKEGMTPEDIVNQSADVSSGILEEGETNPMVGDIPEAQGVIQNQGQGNSGNTEQTDEPGSE